MWVQVMGLLEVVTSNAGVKAELMAQSKPAPSPDSTTQAPVRSADTVSHTQALSGVAVRSEAGGAEGQPNSEASGVEAPRPQGPFDKPGSLENSASDLDHGLDATTILLSLPEPELRNLCKLLAREG